LPPSCVVRPETRNDLPSIAAINRKAFNGEAEAGLIERLRASTPAASFLSLVAEWQGQCVGHILLTPVRIERERETKSAWALAPMAGLPGHQRKGIGSRLVQAGLTRCKALGPGVVIVLGHPAYYARFGFAPASPWGLRCPFPAPDEAFMALGLEAGALDDIAGDVVYPPAFFISE